jgi:DNA adenine methylase
VSWKESVQRYEANAVRNIAATRRKLIAGENVQSGFKEFTLNERGKIRRIKSVHISERIVQKCPCGYCLTPILTRPLIHDNGASIKGKGVHFVLRRFIVHLSKFYRQNGNSNKGYALLVDFIKFFDNIDHAVLCWKQHRQAEVIYQNPEMFDRVKRAWAVWVLANSSYGCILDGGYGYDRTGDTSKKLDNKRAGFTVDYAVRLQRAQIECCDALRIIRSRDVDDSFFYCDPPYVGADQGHYDGYSQEDFDNLLGLLESIQGKFLLSSFRNKSLDDFTRRNGWSRIEIKRECSMTNRFDNPKIKTEILTANYPIEIKPEKRGKKKLVTGKEEAGD